MHVMSVLPASPIVLLDGRLDLRAALIRRALTELLQKPRPFCLARLDLFRAQLRENRDVRNRMVLRRWRRDTL